MSEVITRRNFLKTSAALSVSTAALALNNKVYAAGTDKIRLGIVGCGGRGFYDGSHCLNSSEGIELVAMGDLFGDRIESCLKRLKDSEKVKDQSKIKVTPENCFTGFDAYKKVLASDIDLVILTTPPHFRPVQLKAAIDAGIHAFIEKPVAVDPAGVRMVIEASELADAKGLTIVAGTQARKMAHRIEVMKRIHNGDIGEIITAQCVRNGGGMLKWGAAERKAEWSDMEWQIRRWLFYTWLSGDFITEMHVHELDIMNWAMGGHPVMVTATGGRLTRTEAKYGDVYDHFSAEYEYANGVRALYMGRQMDGCSNRCGERIVGTKGICVTDWANSIIEGEKAYGYEGKMPDPCLRQHREQIEAIRSGGKLNEGKRVAESTLTAIMGRMSAYTGRSLKWDWVLKASKLDLGLSEYKLGDLPEWEIQRPGKSQLV